ncbi:RluA family pseudouridine synthase [Buchnera aphidicola]|uniref:RluA family pseudouridine synthase n=1 Tax=Buchnera aphidicola TaxID=9 RepID=UPI0034649460
MYIKNKITFLVLHFYSSKHRLDYILLSIFPEYSRSFLKKMILSKKILVNNLYTDKVKKNIFLGDHITIFVKNKKNNIHVGENISLNIVYEDSDILIINKSFGLVVHPGNGNPKGTLLNALLYRNIAFHSIPRAGIVHRLDKNTTGLMIIAKNITVYLKLKKLMKDKKIIRKYDAFVLGNLVSGGKINIPIIRNPKKRIYMTTNDVGKSAITYYKIIQKFRYYTHLNIKLETGRTHQIRVHMLYIRFPILGDPVYFLRNDFSRIPIDCLNKVKFFHRQALHASYITFVHPITNIIISCYAAIPSDMVNIIKYL